MVEIRCSEVGEDHPLLQRNVQQVFQPSFTMVVSEILLLSASSMVDDEAGTPSRHARNSFYIICIISGLLSGVEEVIEDISFIFSPLRNDHTRFPQDSLLDQEEEMRILANYVFEEMVDNVDHKYKGAGNSVEDHEGFIKEQDRLLPIANVGRIMKQVLPPNAKISKEAKETMQECVSEFISFVTGEASDKCNKEKRKTVNGDDVCWALSTLGFDNFVDPLRRYLHKYRELDAEKTNQNKASTTTSTVRDERSVFNSDLPMSQSSGPTSLEFKVIERINNFNSRPF